MYLSEMAKLCHESVIVYIFTWVTVIAGVSLGDIAELRWYLGCFKWSLPGVPDGLYEVPGRHTASPALCAKLCLNEGYTVTALSHELCYCSDQTEWFLVNWHKNKSEIVSDEDNLTEGQNSTRWCSEFLCLPYGQADTIAVYRAVGPYIHNVSLSVMTERVQTGKQFLLEVSGHLASPQGQPTGIQSLRPETFSVIGIMFSWSPGSQMSDRVTASADGFFTISPKWTLANPGTYHINVTVSNSISAQSASLVVTAFQPSPTELELTVLQEAKDVPSCAPFPEQDSGTLEKVFLGDTSSLRAFVSTGVSLDFFWIFTDDAHSYHSGSDCHLHSECLSSTVSRTFEKEGIHAVTVNVSNVYGWTQKTIYIAVVKRMLSNLTLETWSGYTLAVGQESSLELELLTNMRQFLSFNITLEPGLTHTHRLADSSPALQAHGHLRLLHTYGPRSCFLHVRLFHRYSMPGSFPVSITVFSSIAMANATLPQPLQVYEPIRDLRPALPWAAAVPTGVNTNLTMTSPTTFTGSVLLWTIFRGNMTVLNQTTKDWSLMVSLRDVGHYLVFVKASNPISVATFHAELFVQDAISGLSSFSLSPEYVQTGSTVIVGATVATGTGVTYIWRFGANYSHITASRTVTHIFSQPGVYSVTVTAENNVSQALSDALEFMVQDPVGGLTVHMPNIATVQHENSIFFSVMTGTNMSVSVFANESVMYSNDSYIAGEEVVLGLVFKKIGIVQVMVRAHNQVSSTNSTSCCLVVQELYMVTIEQLQPPVIGEKIILIAKVNGHVWSNRNYLYIWNLHHNHTVHSGSPVVSLSFDNPGFHRVHVTVEDAVSSITAGVLLNVSALSAAPLLSHPAITAVRSPIQFWLKNLTPGGSLDVNLGDGNRINVSCASVEISFSHTYPQAGLYYVRVTSDSGEILSSVIDVQDPVEGLHLIGPEYFSLPASCSQIAPSMLTWKTTVFQGSNYIYKWNISNRRENVSSVGSNQFTVEVSEPDEFSVEVTVENEVSRLWANLSTSVLYPIMDVSLTAKPTELGQASCVVLTVRPQQHYSLLLDFGDGHRVLSSSDRQTPVTNCSLSPLCSLVFSFWHTYSHSGAFQLSATVSNVLNVGTETSVSVVGEPISGARLVLKTPTVIRQAGFINATALVQTGSDITFQWDISLPEYNMHSHIDTHSRASFLWYQANVPGMYNVTVIIWSPLNTTPLSKHLLVKVCGPISSIHVKFPASVDHTALLPQSDSSYATQELQFSAYTSSMDVTFAFSFGDGSPLSRLKGASHMFYPGAWCTKYHQFTTEGTFFIRVMAYNEFYNSTEVVRPFYVEKIPASLHLTTNSTVIHKDEVILFNAHLGHGTNVTFTWNMGDQTTYVNRGPVVSHLFLTAAVYNVSVTAQNRVGSMTASTCISVLYRIQPVGIYTDKQAYATGMDITFLAVTEEPGPLEFIWYFGDRPPHRTTSKATTKRYHFPGRYNVIVNASNGLSSFTSDIYPIVIQREVQPNRLLYAASVLLNTSANFDLRINRGTNVTYHWNFGDGTSRIGMNTEQHVFKSTGEFTMEVTVSNLVSSTSLTGKIFVVCQPCLPPPVKNMGPLKIQVRRYQTVQLGVTYEAEIQCNISQGILYSWALYESDGLQVQLPPIETHQQSIRLPNNFLHYGTYKAIARVQIQGSIVYSNYTVCIEVVPSLPVSFINGGTNIFINNSNSTFLSLNGQGSYDPDYPHNILRYSWKCKPVSLIQSQCFSQHVPTSSPVIMFPASFLNPKFDQFQLTLSVQSGDRTSTSEVFITISPKLIRKIHVHCYQCQGNKVNWNEKFSVKAHCENCGISLQNISYTWKLYLVNASSKVIVDVPFCKSVDLSLPARIIEGTGPVPPPALFLPMQTSSGTPSLVSATTAVPSTTTDSNSPSPSTAFRHPASNDTTWSLDHPGSQNHTAIMTLSNMTSNMMTLMPPSVPPPPTTPSLPLFPHFPVHFEESQSSGGRARRGRSTKPEGSEISSAEPSPDSTSLTPVPDDYNLLLPPYHISEFPVSPEYNSESDFIDEFPIDTDFPPIFESTDAIGLPVGGSSSESSSGDPIIRPVPGPDFETYYGKIEEAESTGGRHTGMGPGHLGGDDTVSSSSGGEGDNLVDPSILLLTPHEKTLLDLDREPIDPAVFETLSLTGISSPIITFKPFMLKAKSLYMLEVSASSQQTLLGKTQFFFSTNEIPQGLTCQVQPSKGYEIHTDFSVFCTSGKEDLIYEYSFSIGSSPRKVLYQGRDFQHYFNLPSGDPDDDYKVMIYTEIWNRFGAVTKPCPVSVKVLPSFQRNASSVYSPETELYSYSVRNLTYLMQIGNSKETRNYIVLLTNVLNRLSQDPATSLELQTATRTALIAAASQQTITDQGTMVDIIYMLMELMRVTEQVTLDSARLVTSHIQDISAHFKEPSVPVSYSLDEWTVNALVSLLSHALLASFTHFVEGIQLTSHGIRTTTDLLLKYVLFSKAQEYNMSTSLMELKTSQHNSFHSTVSSAGSIKFYLPDALDVHISGRSDTTPSIAPRNACIISQLMFFKQDPYFWGRAPNKINGDIADLSLYNCTTRREIKVRSLSTPINIEFQKRARNGSSASDFSLLRSQMNIHQFNITRGNLQEAVQITVDFIRPANHTFPIMLLFRMFERPTPSLYNTQRIYRWERTSVSIFLPSSSLNAAGTGYLALFNADYKRTLRNKYISTAVKYKLKIESIHCLFWDGVRRWRSDGCSPLQGTSSDKINCSCNHLTTFTVAYQEIQSHHEFMDVSQFISSLNNLMTCSVIVVSLAVYFLVMIVCKQADIQGEKTMKCVLLPDNCPSDQQLYAVTIDTGFRSRPAMTAKVHIVLLGEDETSQTRELNFPENFVFERNSRHTFILSTPESLGPIWKVHLWHDNSGHSPSWYVSHVVVRDLARGCSWFFPGECWLAVDEGDGRVERQLTPLTQGLGFTKLLYLKLTEYLEDFHSWASVYSRPSHSRFTHMQRLSVCLLLLEGYICANTVLISLRSDEQCTVELGLVNFSTVSLVTGMCSMLVVLPVGGLVTLLFRLRKATNWKDSFTGQYKNRKLDIYSVEAISDNQLVDHSIYESYLSCHNLQPWTEKKWRTKCEREVLDWHSPSLVSIPYCELHSKNRGWGTQNCSCNGNIRPLDEDVKLSQCTIQSRHKAEHSCELEQQEFANCKAGLPSWFGSVAWALCLSLSLACVVIAGVLGIKFSTTKSLLWMHSLFFSLLCCVFVVQPTLILSGAIVVSLWYKERSDFYIGSEETEPVNGPLTHWRHNGSCMSDICLLSPYHHPQSPRTHFDRVLVARQRARYLRLARPPTPAELKGVRDKMRKETLIHKTLREAILYIVMLCLLLFITYGKCSNSQYQLNEAVRREFTRGSHSLFYAIKTHNDWWNWTVTTLLDGLYWETWYNRASNNNKASSVQGTSILIGQPILKKIEAENKRVCKVPSAFEGQVPECLPAYSLVADIGPAGRHRHCGHIACYDGAGNRVSLGRTRSEASVQIQELWSRGWLDRYTRAVMVQFTLYNPPTNLFTTVSLLVEQPTTGGLLPSAFIDSVRLYQTSSPFHYTIMACELLFLLLTLLQLYFQMCAMSQKGLLAYWHDTCNWLEITIIIVSLFYYIYYVYHFILAVEIIDDFQKDNFKEFVDLGFISSWEQFTRCLHGMMGFLLLVKCISLLQTNRTMAPSVTLLKMSLSKFPWLLVAGVILMISFASLGNLLFLSGSHSFSSLIRSFQTVITHWPGVSKLKTLSMLYQPNNVSITLFYGSFFFSMSIVWTALIIGTLSSFVKTVKRKTLRGKHLMTFSEVAAYIQDRILVFLGRRKHTWRDNHAQRSNFYFDEFENLVDELLLLVNAFTSSLYNTIPSKEQGYHGHLLTSQPEYTCSLDTEHEAAGEDNLKEKKTSQFGGMLFKNNPDMYSLLLTCEIGSLVNSHVRSNIEFETLWHLQQSQHQNPVRTWSEGSMEASSMYHTDWPEEESRKDTAETSTVLPGSVQVLETPSSPSPCSDLYNLAQLGDDLPHILCGTRCPEKQAAHSKTLQIRMNRPSMDLSAKSRKLLKRSRATVIQPLGGAINGGITGAVSQGTLEAVSALCPDPTQPSAEAAALTVKPTVLQWSGGKYKGGHRGPVGNRVHLTNSPETTGSLSM